MPNADGMTPVDQAGDNRRLMLVFLAWLLFVLWEGYWILEIAERFSKSTHPLQLPYVFLFFMAVVVPFVGYLIFRRRMRQSARVFVDGER